MSQENVEIARRGLDALNKAGVDGVIDLCDPQIEWISIPGFLPDPEDFRGPSGVRAWFDKVDESFSDVRWETAEVIDAGEQLFVALKLAATGRASGIGVEFRVFQAWKIRDRKLVRLESYLSRAEALKAVGLEG